MTESEDLLARAAAGESHAFGHLMQATKADLYRFIRAYVGDGEEAYDLVQETYTAAWLAIGRYDPSRPFEAWLRTIALNKCRDWSRRRAVRRVVRGVMGLDTPYAAAVGDDAPGGETRLDDQRRAALLRHALTELPDTLKAPLLLATLDGRSYADIAAFLRITPKAVETRIARARRRLSEALDAVTTKAS